MFGKCNARTVSTGSHFLYVGSVDSSVLTSLGVLSKQLLSPLQSQPSAGNTSAFGIPLSSSISLVSHRRIRIKKEAGFIKPTAAEEKLVLVVTDNPVITWRAAASVRTWSLRFVLTTFVKQTAEIWSSSDVEMLEEGFCSLATISTSERGYKNDIMDTSSTKTAARGHNWKVTHWIHTVLGVSPEIMLRYNCRLVS